MPERLQKTTPFMEGQNTNDHKGDAPKVKVNTKVAFMKRGGEPDNLTQSLTSPPREFDDTRHFLKRGASEGGHQYKPKWASLTKDTRFSGKATGMGSHSNSPGTNAVGSNSNRKGDNANGNNSNRKGSNVLGSNSNRKGDNALGKVLNKVGQKSGYPSFRPRGGGKKP